MNWYFDWEGQWSAISALRRFPNMCFWPVWRIDVLEDGTFGVEYTSAELLCDVGRKMRFGCFVDAKEFCEGQEERLIADRESVVGE